MSAETTALYFKPDGGLPRGVQPTVFRMKLQGECNQIGRPEEVLHAVGTGIKETMAQAEAYFHYDVVYDNCRGTAALIWDNNILAITDGTTLILSDPAFVPDEIRKNGIGFLGRQESFEKYRGRIPLPSSLNYNGEGSVMAEDVAKKIRRKQKDGTIADRRKDY